MEQMQHESPAGGCWKIAGRRRCAGCMPNFLRAFQQVRLVTHPFRCGWVTFVRICIARLSHEHWGAKSQPTRLKAKAAKSGASQVANCAGCDSRTLARLRTPKAYFSGDPESLF